MFQLPCNQKLMKEQDRLKQKSITMTSNKEAKPHTRTHQYFVCPTFADRLKLQIRSIQVKR